MRLIDADKLISRKWVSNSNDYQKGWNDALDAVIQNEPTIVYIEAESMRHGYWTEYEGDLFCSECNHCTSETYFEPIDNDFQNGGRLVRPKYCGYCGAKMDKKEEETEVWNCSNGRKIVAPKGTFDKLYYSEDE